MSEINMRALATPVSLLLVSQFVLVGLLTTSVKGCGITTHIETGERASSYFNEVSQGINYKQILTRHPDALQAGSPYPDAYYSSLCFGGNYHGESEDTHWTPFINASVNYIRKTYPRPWDPATEKLIAFLFGIITHQVADVTWHSLGIAQGFLDVMGKLNFHGSFSDAHSVGDFGGDVLNVYELDLAYVGLINKWYVPVDDLLNIYEELYGEPDRVPRDVIENCTALLFLGRLGENLGVIDLLYPRIAEQSPFLLDSLNNFYLGGIDDMAAWSGHVWKRAITMLDQGTQTCTMDHNPIYIRCNGERRENEHGIVSATGRNASWDNWDDDAFARAIDLVNPDDIIVRRTERGVVYSISNKLRRRIKARIKTSNRLRAKLDDNEIQPSTVYSTRQSYSRLGEKLLSGDINGDGNDDLVVSAPEFSTASNFQQGRVYVIYGTSNGLPSRNLTIETSADVTLDGPLQENGRFGFSTAIVDVNADGVNDLVVSAPSVGSPTLDYFGRVMIYLNDRDSKRLPTTPSIVVDCTERYCNLGWSLTVGDMNNDGFDDLIVGSPFAPSGGAQRGMVGVLYSNSERKVGDLLTEANFNWIWNGLQDYEWFGFSVDATPISSGETWLAASSPTYRLCRLSDCRYDRNDVQSAGKATLFRSLANSQPAATLTGTTDFEQLGLHVKVAVYNGQDVVIVSAGSADGDNLSPRLNTTQTGLVRFYRIIGNAVETSPWITLSGDRDFDRFGSQVLVYESRTDGRSHVILTSPYRSEDLLTDREGGRVYDMLDVETIDSQANVTYSLNSAKSRFGTSITLVETQGKQQLAVGAPHFTTTLVRLGGQLSIVDL